MQRENSFEYPVSSNRPSKTEGTDMRSVEDSVSISDKLLDAIKARERGESMAQIENYLQDIRKIRESMVKMSPERIKEDCIVSCSDSTQSKDPTLQGLRASLLEPYGKKQRLISFERAMRTKSLRKDLVPPHELSNGCSWPPSTY